VARAEEEGSGTKAGHHDARTSVLLLAAGGGRG
jgi:hypothetical protein